MSNDADDRRVAELMCVTESMCAPKPTMTFTYDYEMMSLAVDIVATSVNNQYVLLAQRNNAPFKDYWVVPGGFVENDETIEEAVVREFKEETTLDAREFTFLGWYDDPRRDERCRVVSMAFHVDCGDIMPTIEGEDDVRNATWFNRVQYQALLTSNAVAFDHPYMICDAIGWGNHLTERPRTKHVNVRTGCLPRC